MHDHTTGTFNLQWSALTPQQQSQFRSFVVEYRRQPLDGFNGELRSADRSGLSASSTGYALSVSQGGNYEFRATAVLSTGQRVSLIGAQSFDSSQGWLRLWEGMGVHAYHRRECPEITYMAMGSRPHSFPVRGVYMKGTGRRTKVKKTSLAPLFHCFLHVKSTSQFLREYLTGKEKAIRGAQHE